MTGEFGAIERIRRALPAPDDPHQVWIGDDMAVLPVPSGLLLLAADSVVAGVHADLSLTGLDDLGWKAMAACLSDVAAMGGVPGYALVTVAAPPGTDLDLLYEGIGSAARAFSCPVVGGDLSNAADTVVTVAVTGDSQDPPVLRRGARAGDAIWVAGPLGASAAGLRLLRRHPRGVFTADEAEAVAAHARPRPHLAAGLAARSGGATAMIDVSDGLAADLGRIADQSRVGFALEGDRLPVHPAATVEEALGGGEDYALVFTAPPDAPVLAAFEGLDGLKGAGGAGAFGDAAPPARVGVCVADPAQRSLDGEPLAPTGWEHSL